jgi:hypothetical protein
MSPLAEQMISPASTDMYEESAARVEAMEKVSMSLLVCPESIGILCPLSVMALVNPNAFPDGLMRV